jgi:DNA-directed RNA polymerase subunit RPC12/RpoP
MTAIGKNVKTTNNLDFHSCNFPLGLYKCLECGDSLVRKDSLFMGLLCWGCYDELFPEQSANYEQIERYEF